MQEFFKSGRYFFAIAIIAFGVIQFVTGNFMSGFLPVSDTLPGRRFFLYLISTLFLVGGLSMLLSGTARRATLLIGFLLLLLCFYPHLVSLLSDLHNPGPWTSIAENQALCGGAFIIAGNSSGFISSKIPEPAFPKLLRAGRILFAISLLVFAVQHFMYADYIATLIPAWIPFKVFLAYFIGVAFTLASISILTNIKTRLASVLLGFMFLFWVVFLHAPRVVGDSQKEAEWTSMFIAFAFCGIFFTLASQYSGKDVSIKN
jgi:uncharacterized membrane protein